MAIRSIIGDQVFTHYTLLVELLMTNPTRTQPHSSDLLKVIQTFALSTEGLPKATKISTPDPKPSETGTFTCTSVLTDNYVFPLSANPELKYRTRALSKSASLAAAKSALKQLEKNSTGAEADKK